MRKWLERGERACFWGVREIGEGNLHINHTDWEGFQYDNILYRFQN